MGLDNCRAPGCHLRGLPAPILGLGFGVDALGCRVFILDSLSAHYRGGSNSTRTIARGLSSQCVSSIVLSPARRSLQRIIEVPTHRW